MLTSCDLRINENLAEQILRNIGLALPALDELGGVLLRNLTKVDGGTPGASILGKKTATAHASAGIIVIPATTNSSLVVAGGDAESSRVAAMAASAM